MKVHRVKQGSDEWFALRTGIPTASNFGKIVTAGGKPSASSVEYAHRLVAERLLGHPVEVEVGTPWMGRGSRTEREARAWYELQRGLDVEEVGFITTDDGTAGCSPDGLVGGDGLLEIKCPTAAVHVGYLLDVEPTKYKPQTQGQLWVTGRAWVDLVSYCPGLPVALIRIERDEEYIAALASALPAFAAYVQQQHERLVGRMEVAA